jgi:hypothetical protein
MIERQNVVIIECCEKNLLQKSLAKGDRQIGDPESLNTIANIKMKTTLCLLFYDLALFLPNSVSMSCCQNASHFVAFCKALNLLGLVIPHQSLILVLCPGHIFPAWKEFFKPLSEVQCSLHPLPPLSVCARAHSARRLTRCWRPFQ